MLARSRVLTRPRMVCGDEVSGEGACFFFLRPKNHMVTPYLVMYVLMYEEDVWVVKL